MGTAISCIECSQVAGLIQKSAETLRKHACMLVVISGTVPYSPSVQSS